MTGLTTRDFATTEGLANRNVNGGSDDVLAGQLMTGGTFLGSSLNVNTGINHNDYETTVLSGGAKWDFDERTELALDLSYVRANQKQEGRGLTFVSAPGLSWDLTRNLDHSPQTLDIAGPDVSNPATWLYNEYGTYQRSFRDDGIAIKLDAVHRFDDSLVKSLKVGFRYATQNDTFRDYTVASRFLATNGAPLTPTRSNGIGVGTIGDLSSAPDNYLGGKGGYAGGFVIYDPNQLFGNSVRDLFPQAGIPQEGDNPEILLSRRRFEEQTYAVYGMADFGFLDDAIRGNAGVRVVRTDTFTRAQISTPNGIQPNEANASYNDVLPTFNLIGNVTSNTLVRFGYGKGITRPDPAALNPSVIINQGQGTASIGNPDLRPQKGDSFDLSFEHYISAGNYASLGLFYKKIDGFFSAITSCETVPGNSYTGPILNGCSNGQFLTLQTVNAQNGSAKGVELAAQTFFDYGFVPDVLQDFGFARSFTYVDTKNPILLNSGVVVDTVQPFTSKYNYSLTGMYENSVVSARLVYTYRSRSQFQGIGATPAESRYIAGFGLLDASLTFNLPRNFQLSLTASNLTNAAPQRFYGEPGYYTGVIRQFFNNGRVFGAALRWQLGQGR